MSPVLFYGVRRRILAGSIAAFVASAAIASAADQTWLNAGPTNNWNIADLNWNGNVAWTQGNSAIFGDTGETITLTTGITADDLTFNSTGFVIASNTLTLTGT